MRLALAAALAVGGCRDASPTHEQPEPTRVSAPADASAPTKALPDLDAVTVTADEVLEVQGSKMMLDPADKIISRVIKRDGIWEPVETALFEREVKPGYVVVDAGANIGYYTLLAARLVGATGHVYAFEPEPNAFALLQRNVHLNGYTNVTLVPTALGREPGTMQLFIATKNRGDHRIYNPTGKRSAIDVEVVTLDAFLAEHEVSRVDLLKIDTQGAECSILAGAEQTLTRRELSIVMEFTPAFLEAVGDDPRACLTRLAGSGYAFADILEWERNVAPTDVDKLLATYPATDAKKYTNLFLTRPR
jgi:FkbM family methyltransferase